MSWALTAFSILGALLNSQGLHYISYLVWAPTNAVWTGYFLSQKRYPEAVLFFTYLVISYIGCTKHRR